MKAKRGRPRKWTPALGARQVVKIDPARLTYWRNMRVMTRRELAEAARISFDSVVSYEMGRRCPKEKIFRRLITALGIGPENLLFNGYRYNPIIEDEELEDEDDQAW